MSNIKNVIFIDKSVEGYNNIIENLPKNTQYFFLEKNKDGIEQIVEAISKYNDLNSIQIVSHGDAAELSLGSSVINNENVETYEDSLFSIGQSLSETGDILLYGCNVAASSGGESFVNKISQFTNAGVAASNNLTGYAALGGDFILEYKTDLIETQIINLDGIKGVLWANALQDATIKTKVLSAQSDSSFSFLEMRDILDTAKLGGINNNEWLSLNSLYDNVLSADQFSNEHVKYASYSVIKGNSKFNDKWYGGATKKSDIKTVGNMQSGTNETNANYLIQEWFYGADIPMPIAGGDSANPDSAKGVYQNGVYSSSASLYKNDDLTSNFTTNSNVTVTADDVNQGQVGSCYLVAALGSMAHIYHGTSNAGKLIKDIFIETGDPNVYGVQYYLPGGQKIYVTVNTQIATKNSWGTEKVIFSGNFTDSLDGEMWVSLLEKSYAQFNQLLGRSGGINSYSAIEGGLADPIYSLTGLDFTYYSGNSNFVWGSGKKLSADNTGKQVLIDALANNQIGWIGAWEAIKSDGKTALVGQHAHMLLDYDSSTDKFLMRNPWGGNESSGYKPEWWMSYNEFVGPSKKTLIAFSKPAATPKTFTYTLSSDSASATNTGAKVEGQNISFTIKRDSSGEESIVYLSTVSGSADKNDYKEFNKEQLKFLSHETTKTFEIETFKDVSTEGTNGFDNFKLALYKTQLQTTPTVQETAYIKDNTPPNYLYTINNNASSDSAARSEGGKVKFTITRDLNSNSAEDSTVYISTILKNTTATASDNTTITGAGKNDFVAIENLAVEFKAIETTKKIYVTVNQDSNQEGFEFFDLNLYKDFANSGTAVTSTAYIKDEWQPTYNYTITSDAGNDSSAKNEGDKVTFTVTRSGAGTESTVYLSTANKTAVEGDDYIGFEGKKLTFTKNQNSLNVEVQTRLDTWVEPVQFFDLELYTNVNDKTVLTSGSAYIKDTFVEPDKYTITNTSISTGDDDAIAATQDPGGSGNLNLTGSPVSLSGGKIVTITSASDDSAIKFTVTGKDQEDDDIISALSAGTVSGALSLINNATASFEAAHKITITSTGNDSGITFTIVGTDATGTAQTESGLTGADTGVATSTKKFKTVESISTVGGSTANKVKAGILANDISEVIQGSNVGTSTGSKVFSKVSQVAVDGNAGSVKIGYLDGINEGSDVTFTITRTNPSNAAASIFVDTSNATAKEEDFAAKEKSKISFAEYENTKTFTISTKSDSVTDDNEFFWARFYMNESTTEAFANSQAFINDVAVPTSHTYTITNNSPNSSPITEGGDITFTIKRATSGGQEASTIYVSTLNDGTDNEDLVAIDKLKIDFGAKDNIKTVTVKTKTDAITDEGKEDFFLLLYDNLSDAQEGNYKVYNEAFIGNAAAADYKYAVSSDVSYSSPVEEEGVITFTVTRTLNSGNAAASTVYVSTTAGSANSNDYISIDKQALSFAKQQTSKTVKVTTLTDSETEGREYFWFDIFKTYDDAEVGNYSTYATGYITDPTVVATDYTYAIKSSHDKAFDDDMVSASQSATGSALALVGGSTVTLASPSKVTITSGGDDSNKTFTVVGTDASGASLSETITGANSSIATGEKLFKTVASITPSTTTAGTVKAGAGNAIKEGEDASFTITRTLNSGSAAAETIYISTAFGTADAEDFTPISKLAIDFKSNETTKEVKVNTLSDSTSDDGEYFFLNLFKSSVDADNGNYDKWGKAFISNDASSESTASTYQYSISSSAGSTGSAATEGNDINFTITRSREDSSAISSNDVKSTVYLSTSDGSAYSDDYVGLNKYAVEFKNDETTKTVTVKTIVDSNSNEPTGSDAEYFWIDLYKSIADADNHNYHSYSQGYIIDDTSIADAINNFSYSVSSSHGSSGSGVTEGGEVTFTITRAKTGGTWIPTTIYASTSEGTAYNNDFIGINAQPIEFKQNETTKTVVIKTNTDDLTDDDEYFWFDLFKTKADIDDYNYAAWGQGFIANNADSAIASANYSYEVTGDNNAANKAVKEGQNAIFTITRTKTGTGADAATTIYYSSSVGTASEDDFEVITNKAIEFKANETSKTITIATKSDDKKDDDEYFWFDIYKTLSDAENYNYYKWDYGYIDDDASSADAASTYKYTISSINDTDNGGSEITEGGKATFTITRARIDNASISESNDIISSVYISTAAGTADEDDFSGISKQLVEFKKGDTTKTITVDTKGDKVTDDGEYFTLELFKTLSDFESGDYHSYGRAYINDDTSAANAYNNFNYTVSSNNETSSNAASEGDPITFEITRTKITGSDMATTVYVSTSHATTDSDDITSLNLYPVEFKAGQTKSTLEISSNTDSETEGNEYFWLDLFKSKADADDYNYHSYASGYLKDNTDAADSVNNYSYTISSSAGESFSAVEEGSNITFTITRTLASGKTAAKSTVYLSTSESLASSDDFKSKNLEALEFKANETTKTVTVETYADEDTEGEEYFYLDLFKTKADASDYNYAAYNMGYIKDPSGGSSTNYTYSITTDSGSSSANTEGANIVATITRTFSSGSAGESTIYLNTTAGSANEDDYVAQKVVPISFGSVASGATKTVTITTLQDIDDSEPTESFYLDLFKTIADAEDGYNYFDYATAYIADGDAIASGGITYSITNNSGSSSPKNEGSQVTFTISDGNSSLASTVYVSTVEGGNATSGDDYKVINKQQVDFGTSDSSKTVTVDLYNDTVVDDNESFFLELYKTSQDADSGSEAVFSQAFINEVTPVQDDWNYTITNSSSSSNATEEGSNIVFTITRSGGTVSATTIYAKTTASTAGNSDYTAITSPQAISFSGSNDLTKTVTITTTSDSETEDKEYFWLDLFKSKADADANNYFTYDTGYIKDPSSGGTGGDNYSFSISSNANSVTEGSNAVFTITKSGSGSSSATVYISTPLYGDQSNYTSNYAGTSDITPLDHKAITFAADETSKTVSVSTTSDSVSENASGEMLYVFLSTSATSAITDWSEGYGYTKIKDPSGSLSLNKGANSGNVGGSTVTITSAPKNSFPGHKAGQFFNDYAFAAKTSSGSVVTWGNTVKGGDKGPISHLLSNVANIYSNNSAFAVVKSDGSVVTWGDSNAGGTSWDLDGLSLNSTMTSSGNLTLGGAETTGGKATFSQPHKITITSVGNDSGRTFTVNGKDKSGTSISETISGANASTAKGTKLFKSVDSISVDGATDGGVSAGSISSLTFDIAAQLDGTVDVSKIASTPNAFAAVRTDGSVVAWGASGTGGDIYTGGGAVDEDLDGSVSKVRDIYSNENAFAALREDGTVITWGFSQFGGSSTNVANKIKNKNHSDFNAVTDIVATGSAFAAIRSDGSVVTWGNVLNGGDSSSVASDIDGDTNLHDVVQVYATTSSFAALRKDGSVITWGDANNGGTSSDVASKINGATDTKAIYATNDAFAALRSDGSVVTWGNTHSGGNSTSVANELDGGSDTTEDITKIYSTTKAFAAIRADGLVVTWGYNGYGGDSSSVSALINGSLDSDCIAKSATLSGTSFSLNGDLISSGSATFINPQKVTISSVGDDSARTFTVSGTDKSGTNQSETITGANAGTATSSKYFKTVSGITVDAAPSAAVSAGVVDKTVTTISSTDKAFAALRADGSVITWGDKTGGGDSSDVSTNLILSDTNSAKVTQLYASSGAFSAIKSDGSVVTWGDTDRGGDSTSVDFSSTSVSGMSGASSGGMECNVKFWKQHNSSDVTIKNTSVTLMTNASTPQKVSGNFTIDSSGKLDLSDANSGNYTGSFIVTNSSHLDASVDIFDVLAILDYTTGSVSPTADQIVAANVLHDTTDKASKLDIFDVLRALDMSTGTVTPGETVLRDASASAATYNSDTSAITNYSNVFSIQTSGTLNLNSYLLGDIDGDYATQIG